MKDLTRETADKEYVKRTMENINFPLYNYNIIKQLIGRIKSQHWTRKSNHNLVACAVVEGEDMQYCSDGIRMIEKFLSDDEWEFKMTSYKRCESIRETYIYTFYIKNIKYNYAMSAD